MPIVEFLNAVSFYNEQHRAKTEKLREAKQTKDWHVYTAAMLEELLLYV